MINPKYLVKLYDGIEVLNKNGRSIPARVIACNDYEKIQIAGDTHYKFKTKHDEYSVAKSKVFQINELSQK